MNQNSNPNPNPNSNPNPNPNSNPNPNPNPNYLNFKKIIIDYINKKIKLFYYGSTNTICKNPAKKYIENYIQSNKLYQFEKLPILYTNPRWDELNKKPKFNNRVLYNYYPIYLQKQTSITNKFPNKFIFESPK
jgi:hypothetical protein